MVNRTSGQALVESIFLIPLIGLIVISIAWFSRVLITRQQLVLAARYGTDLIANTSLNESQIRREIRNFLSHHMLKSRKLDARKLPDENIVVTIKDFPPVDISLLSVIKNPGRLGQMIAQMADPLSATSSVEIRYAYAVPPFVRAVARRSLYVSARSEVLSGSGCQSSIHAR